MSWLPLLMLVWSAAATEHIERMVEETEAEVSKLQADLAGVKGRMKELKS